MGDAKRYNPLGWKSLSLINCQRDKDKTPGPMNGPRLWTSVGRSVQVEAFWECSPGIVGQPSLGRAEKSLLRR